MSQTFIRFISKAARGSIPTDLVTQLLSLSIPTMANFMLPLSLFLAILFALGSFCSQSEMVAMRAVGYSNKLLLKISMGIAFVTAIANGVCSLWLAPWCEAKQYEIIDKAKSDPSFFAIDSGRFLKYKDLVIYVEDLEEQKGPYEYQKEAKENSQKMKQLYVLTPGNEQKRLLPSVNLSNEGWISFDKNDSMWVNLKNGYIYEGPDEKGEYNLVSYEKYRLHIPTSDEKEASNKISSKSTLELWEQADSVALTELEWRLVQPISIFVLVLIVVPLSMVNPRQGRFAKFLPAVAIYISYFLVGFGLKSACSREVFPLIPGLMFLPILFCIAFAIPFNLSDTEVFNKLRRSKLLNCNLEKK